MEETGSKLGKEHIKAVYYHIAYLTHMQSTSYEIPGWMKHLLIKIAGRNINNFRYFLGLQTHCRQWLQPQN